MSSAEAARRWSSAWKAGWEALEVEPIVACYSTEDGLVVEQWDAWNQLDDRRDPPDWSPLGGRDTRPVA